MSLSRSITIVAIAGLAASTFPARGQDVRSRTSFNEGWKFARFGPMPDGATRPEPGAPRKAIRVEASSEEAGRGNTADLALDGDPGTRWCAAGEGTQEWLEIDLGRAGPASSIEIDWEFRDLEYAYAIDEREGGRRADTLARGTSRRDARRIELSRPAHRIRIRISAPPAGKWASIREVRLYDSDRKAIDNESVPAGEAPWVTTFPDDDWRSLSVPHDWGIEGPFRDDLPGDTGKLPWKAIGWYRKHFRIPASDEGRRVFLDFDGAMANSRVWLNDREIGGWPYGYQPFRLELTKHLKYGGENVVAVRLDTVHWGSRWYPGGGLYRNVWLEKTSPVHVGHWGVFATTPGLTDEKGTVNLAVAVDNQGDGPAAISVRSEVHELASDGTPSRVAARSGAVEQSIPAGRSGHVTLSASVGNPRRWDLDHPDRYLARVVVEQAGKIVDVYDQPFGFRTIEFTPRDGVQLNGRRVFLKGTCNHHDLGPLGAALNVSALERQLTILKEMGDNALRTSHNPPAPELLDLADRMGFLVMVEAFDCWKEGKTANDYSRIFDAWHDRDLRAMVRRERNHPSVAFWSIGNEIAEQDGPGVARPLREIVRAEDPTRPVTAGCNQAKAGTNEFRTAVDVFGLNYNLWAYGRIVGFPPNADKPIYTSESSSCVSSRGEYFFPVERGKDSQANFQVSSYDVDAPPWAQPPDEVFEALDRNPAFFGEFVWTGFDYIGEPTPYNSDATNLLNFSDPTKKAEMKAQLEALGRLKVPSASSYFGILDLCGFRKDRFYIYQARWRPELPMAHVLPHWNWPERVGQATPVHVYTSGDEAELFQDGTSLGRKKRGRFEYRLRWDDVTYRPGGLEVVAYREGKEWARDRVSTTGEPAKLRISPERPGVRADGRDLAFFTVAVADGEGRTVPRSHNLVEFAVDGPGEIVAVGNGDATSHEPFQARRRSAYNGLCQVIVKGRPGSAGRITVRATSPGLAGADASVEAR
ncbi:Beta-galactosidase [Aquisphaera giovannonii]|uniref:Beta-galactosidase n=1 Tax=Aquisphaera giovannonii TaxID=406548 RepID=A0A5B9WB43_9BACT|nr:beta-galactosidase GalB [Aquisphaera giovannonii]QEH37231.1 Beta-galactosidase [Aquisphaera giovannonii]